MVVDLLKGDVFSMFNGGRLIRAGTNYGNVYCCDISAKFFSIDFT